MRANPLPPGRYWVVITGADTIAQFDLWLHATVAGGGVRVDATQVISESGVVKTQADLLLLLVPVLGAIVAAQRSKDPDQEFVVFTVLQEGAVIWPGGAFGLPSKAAAGVTAVEQVEQAPAAPPSFEQTLEGMGATLKGAAEFAVAAGVVIGGLWLWSKFK